MTSPPYRAVAPSAQPREARGWVMLISPSIFRGDLFVYGPYRWRWTTAIRAWLQITMNPSTTVLVMSSQMFWHELLPLQTLGVQRSFTPSNRSGFVGTLHARLP